MLTKNLTKGIKILLRDMPELRDDDEALMSYVWRHEVDDDKHSISAYAFWGMLSRHEVSSPESIRRTRQKIQEELPEYRGNKWGKRHKVHEPQVRQEIKQMKKDIQPQGGLFDGLED